MLLSDIATALNGEGKFSYSTVNQVITDSREIERGCLFIALKGENFDGHDFVKSAIDSGAAVAVVSKDFVLEGYEKYLMKVESPDEAYLELASYYRSMYNISLVGVTGSVGKTTTKDMIAAVLSSVYEVHKTGGNFNNAVGLPKTLLELKSSTEVAVIEMGMDGFGQISSLSRTAKPTMAVITNIGISHLESLGTRENILKAKLEILDGLEHGGVLIINSDDEYLSTVTDDVNVKIVRFAIDDISADVLAYDITRKGNKTRFKVRYKDEIIPLTIPAVGRHMVYNALAALVVGKRLKMTNDKIIAGIKSYQPSGMRQRITKKSGVNLIEDCYNASPDSMRAAIDVLSSMSGRKIAVLGGMLELGSVSDQSHRDIGEYCSNKVDAIFTYGEYGELYSAGAKGKNVKLFKEQNQLAVALKEFMKSDDWVLFKASRGIALEKIIKKVFGE